MESPCLPAAEIQRLGAMLEPYAPGERVRALCEIISTEGTTPANALGTVVRAGVFGCSALVQVQWENGLRVTSAENLVPAERPRAPLPPALALLAGPEPTPESFVLLCRAQFDVARAELRTAERAWIECLDDLSAVGVVRPGHKPPEGVEIMIAAMQGVRRAVNVLELLIGKLPT